MGRGSEEGTREDKVDDSVDVEVEVADEVVDEDVEEEDDGDDDDGIADVEAISEPDAVTRTAEETQSNNVHVAVNALAGNTIVRHSEFTESPLDATYQYPAHAS